MKITDEMVEAAVKAVSDNVDWVRGLFGQNYDNATEVMRDALTAALSASPAGVGVETQPWNNDTIWARFYRDGKTLGEICEEFKCGVYDLSPWLTAPLVRAALTKEGEQ
jgi:hypothetical protein